MNSTSISPEKALFAEMAQRLAEEDLKDLSTYDYPEERNKHLVALKSLQRRLYAGTGDNIYPREALLEFSWKKLSSKSTRQHEKRIFSCCFLILNYCADIQQWLGFDTTVGNLIQSIICVDLELLKMAKSLFIHAEDSLDDDEHIIFAKLGSLVCYLNDRNLTAVNDKLQEIEALEETILRRNKKNRTAKIGNFSGLEQPMIIEGWHATRQFIRNLNEETEHSLVQTKISDLCDRLWMPTEHYFWKYNEREPRE